MKKSRFFGRLWVALFLAGLTGTVSGADASFKVGVFTFQTPEKWERVETRSPMRKAQLRVSSSEAKAGAEVVFFHFGPNNGGGTQANVERWFGQFKESRDKINARSEESEIGGHKITYVEAEGTFMSGMPGGPREEKPGYALLGAIIGDAGGSVFVKMTGPAELVKQSKTELRKMIEGAVK